MIVPTVKFVMHDSLACKRAYGGGYLLDGKRQAYFVGKASMSTSTCSLICNLEVLSLKELTRG
jgi:hypothetical protein